MEACKDTTITLYISMKDAKRLAKLPGKGAEWAISALKAYDEAAEDYDSVFRVEFVHTETHKV
jgi:hypothetical protein